MSIADNIKDLAFSIGRANVAAAQAAYDARQPEIDRLREENRKLRAALKEHAPYKEWCSDPLACHGKGTCPRDPNCGD